MKKLLGKVSVYVDTEITGDGQSSYERKLDGNNYEILLTPKVDKYHMESSGLPYSEAKNTATTLAHEFGHLIGRLLHSPAQEVDLPAEREAWTLADIEYPSLDKKEESLALGMDERNLGGNS